MLYSSLIVLEAADNSSLGSSVSLSVGLSVSLSINKYEKTHNFVRLVLMFYIFSAKGYIVTSFTLAGQGQSMLKYIKEVHSVLKNHLMVLNDTFLDCY